MAEPKVADPLPHHVETRHRYSIGKALRQLGDAGEPNGRRNVDGLESEVDQELRRRGFEGQGLLVPLDARSHSRPRAAELRSLDSAAGSGSVQTTLLEVIDVLRARAVVTSLGAKTLDLGGVMRAGKGLASMPRKSATLAPSWVAEGGSPGSGTAPAFADQAQFRPHTLTGYVDATRIFLSSSIPTIEDVIFGDLSTSIGVEVDRVSLVGAGSGQPAGLSGNVPAYAGGSRTNGASLSLADLCAIELAIGAANADAAAGARLGWATTPQGRSKLRQTEKVATSGRMLWTDEDTILGRPALATSNLPSNLTKGSGSGLSSLLYGNWADLVVAHWGAMDLLVDPYQFSATGFVRFRAYWDVDIQPRHLASWMAVNDFLTS